MREKKQENFCNRLINFFSKVTKTDLFIFVTTAATTAYYVSTGTAPYFGNITAFTFGVVGGAGLGALTVCGSEKDALKLTAELESQIENALQTYQNNHIEHLTLEKEHQILDLLQIKNQKNIKLMEMFIVAFGKQRDGQLITQNDLSSENGLQSSGRSSTAFTGSTKPAPDKTKFPDLLSLQQDEFLETQTESLSRCAKILAFYKISSKTQLVAMIGNGLLVFYSVQYALNVKIEDYRITAPIGVFFGFLGGPPLTALTTHQALGNVQKLQNRLKGIQNYNDLFEAEFSWLKSSIETLKSSYEKHSRLVSDFTHRITEYTRTTDITSAQFFSEFQQILESKESTTGKLTKRAASHSSTSSSSSSFSYTPPICSSSVLTGSQLRTPLIFPNKSINNGLNNSRR